MFKKNLDGMSKFLKLWIFNFYPVRTSIFNLPITSLVLSYFRRSHFWLVWSRRRSIYSRRRVYPCTLSLRVLQAPEQINDKHCKCWLGNVFPCSDSCLESSPKTPNSSHLRNCRFQALRQGQVLIGQLLRALVRTSYPTHITKPVLDSLSLTHTTFICYFIA